MLGDDVDPPFRTDRRRRLHLLRRRLGPHNAPPRGTHGGEAGEGGGLGGGGAAVAGLEGEARGKVAREVGRVGADATNHTRLPQLDDAPVVAGHALAPGLPPVHPLYCVGVGGGGWVGG